MRVDGVIGGASSPSKKFCDMKFTSRILNTFHLFNTDQD